MHQLINHIQECLGPALPIALAVASSAYKFAKGLSQNSQAKKLLKTPRPIKTTPNQIFENTAIARNEAGKWGLPGQGIIEDKMDADVSNAVNALLMSQQDPASMAQGAVALNYNKLGALGDLNLKAAQYRTGNINRLMSQNAVEAQFENQNWDWNKKMPYLDAMAAASALKNAGERNIMSSINDIAKLGISAFGNGAGNGAGTGAAGYSGAGRFLGSGTAPEADQSGKPIADVNTERSAADLYVDEAKKANEEKMFQKALRMNPSLTREQYRLLFPH